VVVAAVSSSGGIVIAASSSAVLAGGFGVVGGSKIVVIALSSSVRGVVVAVVAVFVALSLDSCGQGAEAGGMALWGLEGWSVAESGANVGSLSMGGFVVCACIVWGGELLCGAVWLVLSVHGICCGVGMVVIVWLLNS